MRCSNGPERLVGDDHLTCRTITATHDGGQDLPDTQFGGRSRIGSRRVADAQDGDQTVAERRLGLRGDNRVGLIEQSAAFRMADLDMGAADLGELGARDFASKCATVVRGKVLGSDVHLAVADRLVSG